MPRQHASHSHPKLLHQVPEVGIALGGLLALDGLVRPPSTAADIATGTSPVGADTTGLALGVVLKVHLVATVAIPCGGTLTSVIRLLLLSGLITTQEWVVDELVSQQLQPGITLHGAHHHAVRLEGVHLAHAQACKEHAPLPCPGLDRHLEGQGTKAVPVEKVHSIEVPAVHVVHARLCNLVGGAAEPLVSIILGTDALLLLGVKAGTASAEDEEGLLVHECPSKKGGGPNLQCHVGLHEALGEALALHLLHQELLRVSPVTGLDGEQGVEAKLVHEPLASLARPIVRVSNHNPASALPWLALPQDTGSALANLVTVVLQGLPFFTLGDLCVDHHLALGAGGGVHLNAKLRWLPRLVSHVHFPSALPENHTLVHAQHRAWVPRILPGHGALGQQLHGGDVRLRAPLHVVCPPIH